MAKYTLLLRETGDQFAKLSPAEMQAIVARYAAWSTALRDANNLAGSQKLRDGSADQFRRTTKPSQSRRAARIWTSGRLKSERWRSSVEWRWKCEV